MLKTMTELIKYLLYLIASGTVSGLITYGVYLILPKPGNYTGAIADAFFLFIVLAVVFLISFLCSLFLFFHYR